MKTIKYAGEYDISDLKLFTASWAEMFDRPIVISSLSFDLKENPLVKSFSWIDESPRSKIIVSAFSFKI